MKTLANLTEFELKDQINSDTNRIRGIERGEKNLSYPAECIKALQHRILYCEGKLFNISLS